MNNKLSPPSNAPAGELHSVSGLFIIPCLFTAAGGYMDAFSYIAHGHVFANAQTGNFGSSRFTLLEASGRRQGGMCRPSWHSVWG
ncbi:MAG: DUF1275 family protein [Candidatus Acidiferrales bacterium]